MPARTTPLGREVCHCELLVICTNQASVDRKKTSLYSRLVVASPKSLDYRFGLSIKTAMCVKNLASDTPCRKKQDEEEEED
jgi:hypothetical protein